MIIVPRDWEKFRHYKNRSAPWIKLHRNMLKNEALWSLPDASIVLAFRLFLLANEHALGAIEASVDNFFWHFRTDGRVAMDALKPLIDNGFFVVLENASTMLASCYHDASKHPIYPLSLKKREEEEVQKTKTRKAGDARARKTKLSEGFSVSDRVRKWSIEKGYGKLEEHLESFVAKCKARDYSYVDWDSAFMEAIREDWAKLRGGDFNRPAPPPDLKMADPDSRGVVEAEGIKKGIGKWNEMEPWHIYKAKVRGGEKNGGRK